MSTISEKIVVLWHLFIKEVLKFGIVGGLAFVVNATVTWVLMHSAMQGSEVKAKFVAGVVATIFSWVLNRLWTFKDKRQDNKWREAAQFAVVNIIGILVEMGCVWVAKYLLHMTSPTALFVAGTIIGTILGTVVRYFAYRFWVYGTVQGSRQEDDFTREEKVGRFMAEATNIVTGKFDVDAVRRGARDPKVRESTGRPDSRDGS